MATLSLNLGLLTLLLALSIPASQQQTLRSLAEAHQRYIGSAVSPQDLNEGDFTKVLDANIDCLTPDNAMKWDATEGTRGKFSYGGGDSVVAHAQAHNMKVRGHTLLWHAQLPGWVTNGHFSAAELKTVLHNHIANVAGHYKGKIYAWDVVNEIFNEDGSFRDSVWFRTMGKSFVAEAFKAAHEADPGAKLYINDYNCDGINRKSTGMYNLIKELKAEGVPIHGAGLQAHMSAGHIPGDLEANLKRFSDLGVDVALTELDIAVKPVTDAGKAQQGQDYGKVFKACVDVPRCVGITMWGLTDKHTWIAGSAPLIYDEHYGEKAAVKAIRAAFGK